MLVEDESVIYYTVAAKGAHQATIAFCESSEISPPVANTQTKLTR